MLGVGTHDDVGDWPGLSPRLRSPRQKTVAEHGRSSGRARRAAKLTGPAAARRRR
ncbi:hypothetical protein [Lysobacter gummosus]|uniref:hypothetical protein n=1 Tax=Lysobacter gummosus TaxID=262324 RepID=UPI00362733A0